MQFYNSSGHGFGFSSESLRLSRVIESILVARNPRGMQFARAQLNEGYYFRAASLLQACLAKPNPVVLIGTGFPVSLPEGDFTFETDGPMGAIALYDTLSLLGGHPIIVAGGKLASALSNDYRVHTISEGDLSVAETEAREALVQLKPDIIVSIEMPGLNSSGHYANMRGENISTWCASFDDFLRLAPCPTIAIGDGGNEIGMGNIAGAIKVLNIIPARTCCDELLIADVSNWGAYGLIVWLSLWHKQDLLEAIKPRVILKYLSQKGSVDGISHLHTQTEDGLLPEEGERVITELRRAAGFY